MKRPYTVWLEQEDVDWVQRTGGFENFSLAMRILIHVHKRESLNRRVGYINSSAKRKGQKRRPRAARITG